jgi:DNA (cytosine-5)-methyltransferase 1
VSKPLLLDLFCGVGGCAVGYHRAGFEVVGVDIVRQPNYPFEFIATDAVTLLQRLVDGGWVGRPGGDQYSLSHFDAIHASPPCKRWTVARRVAASREDPLFEPHPDLLTPSRELLEATGLPYVIENVPGAPLKDPVTICGSAFSLRVRRHRLFESNFPLEGIECRHAEQGSPVGVYGNGGAWTRTAPGGGGVKVAGAEAAAALGIDWTTHQPELSQAIPPAYTEHIGRQMIARLQEGITP